MAGLPNVAEPGKTFPLSTHTPFDSPGDTAYMSIRNCPELNDDNRELCQCSNKLSGTSTTGETKAPMLPSQSIISAFDIASLPAI